MVMKENLKRIRTPQDEISDAWIIEEIGLYFDEKLNEYYNVNGIALNSVKIARHEENLIPDMYLTLSIGLDKETGEVEAQLLNNCSFAASVVTRAIGIT